MAHPDQTLRSLETNQKKLNSGEQNYHDQKLWKSDIDHQTALFLEPTKGLICLTRRVTEMSPRTLISPQVSPERSQLFGKNRISPRRYSFQ
jgi:hypothetical protein